MTGPSPTPAAPPQASPASPAQPPFALTGPDRELVRRFARGEITFAQLEGMTADEALRIAGLGHQLFRQGRLGEARALFEGLSAVNPLDPYPHQVLGAICEREGRGDAARRHYDVCLSLQPDNAWVLGRRGEVRLLAGDALGGVADLTRACELDPHPDRPGTRRVRLLLAALADAARKAGAEAGQPLAGEGLPVA